MLDEQLRRTYESYDEILRREQAEARGAAERASSGAAGGTGGNEPQGGSPGGRQQPGGQPGGANPNGAGADVANAGGRPGGPPGGGNQQQTFPPPEDIPGGRDDDVVARQLREAAMTEPDPELREALWDEYRNYTGIAEPG